MYYRTTGHGKVSVGAPALRRSVVGAFDAAPVSRASRPDSLRAGCGAGAAAQGRKHHRDDASRRVAHRPHGCRLHRSCSPTASPVPATAPPTGPTSVRPKAAANSTCIVPTRCPGKTSGSTRSGATSVADSAPRSILAPTSRTNVYGGGVARGSAGTADTSSTGAT